MGVYAVEVIVSEASGDEGIVEILVAFSKTGFIAEKVIIFPVISSWHPRSLVLGNGRGAEEIRMGLSSHLQNVYVSR